MRRNWRKHPTVPFPERSAHVRCLDFDIYYTDTMRKCIGAAKAIPVINVFFLIWTLSKLGSYNPFTHAANACSHVNILITKQYFEKEI